MKISVVTPAYNSEKYIRETILSIKNQSYTNYEHIIIDGASKDGTLNIIREYDHIVYKSEKDNGQSDALNKGFKLATGEIFAWQNADDLYCSNAFNDVVAFFQQNPSVDVVYGYYQLIDESSKWLCDIFPIDWNEWLFAHGRFVPLQPTVFWRRKVHESVGEIESNLHYCMDVDFYAKAVKKHFVFKRIPAMLGKFRVHDESKTQNKDNEKIVYEECKYVLSSHFNYSFLDLLIFKFFQQRAKIAKKVKKRWLKKL